MHKQRAQDEKAARRLGRQHGDAADAAFDAGDYKTALRLYLQTVHTGPETEVGHRAMVRAQLLRIDPVAVYAGVGTMLLVGMASVWALSN
jgi:hypothetical protein